MIEFQQCISIYEFQLAKLTVEASAHYNHIQPIPQHTDQSHLFGGRNTSKRLGGSRGPTKT
jgi:hypothetical protein